MPPQPSGKGNTTITTATTFTATAVIITSLIGSVAMTIAGPDQASVPVASPDQGMLTVSSRARIKAC